MKEEKNRIGRVLKSARLEKGITLEKASKDTKITQKYLKSIEDEQFLNIPGEVVLKGFLRIYADYLKIDPGPLISELSKKIKKEPKAEIKDQPVQKKADIIPLLKNAMIVLSAVAAAVVIIMVLRSLILVSVRTADIRPADKTGTSDISKKISGSVEIEARIIEKTWIMVLSDGKMVFKDVVLKGQSFSWKAKDRLLIKIGNAAGVHLSSKGKVVLAPGPRGSVITKEFSR
ncbi:MAG: helix-turn-helix domain-containing protein [Candidatus Saganbacteria bacterium]|nr:helix-turn-helix domain-containing protein [Candidatus Saganbacteria bacterium]